MKSISPFLAYWCVCVRGSEIFLKILRVPSTLGFSAKYSFLGQTGQFLSRGHYQPPEGVYSLIGPLTR